MKGIHQIVFGYIDLCLLIFKTIKIDMETAQKTVKNLSNENIFSLKASL